ncbi:ribonuclease H-like domain-containing protein [Tanacetum coccineum]
MTPSSLPPYTFLEPTTSPLLNTLTSASIPPPTTHETTQPNNMTIPNAEPNTLYAPTPQGPNPTEPQSTLPTSIAHNHASGPSTLAHQTSLIPPPIFDLLNPQPNTKPVHEPLRTHPMITRSQSGIVKPIDRLSLHTSSISLIPKNPSHALKDPNWRNAMYDEYNALVKNGTWLLVPRPAGVNMVRSMWLFKHKFHADGTLSCYKARLVVNNSSHQLGDLSETVYMHQPPGFVDNRYPHHVCLLQRSLYGLKQAPRAWFQRFAGYATRAGFYHSRCDSSLFIYRQGSQVAYLLIYVDDIILTASCPALLQQIIGLFLSQKKYALQLLERAHMVTCNPSRTPIDTKSKLGPKIFLYMHDSREPHFAALKRILRYVRGTMDFGLQLYVSATTSLVGYTDADWAGCPSTRNAEAEYRGVANVVAQIAWIRNLLHELHSPLSTVTLIYHDNVSVVYMSANPVQHQRTKHIEIDIHFVRDMVTAGHVRVLHIPSRF